MFDLELSTLIFAVSNLYFYESALVSILVLIFSWKKKKLFPLLIIILINIPNISSLTHCSFSEPQINIGASYRILTFNKYERNSNKDAILNNLKTIKADLIAVQEISDADFILNDPLVRRNYPFSFFSPTINKLFLSKYKITNSYDVRDFQIAEIKLASKKLSIINVHMPKIFMNKKAHSISKKTLFEIIKEIKGQLVLVGDFNVTPYDSLYRTIKKEYEFNDSFQCSGAGFGFTFPSPTRSRLGLFGRLFRIDYIFGRNVQFIDAEVIEENSGSDHYPVITSFTI